MQEVETVETEVVEEAPKQTEIAIPVLKQQVSRESVDPFKEPEKPKERKSLLSRLMRRQKPSPDSIKYSVIGLYGAQATMLAAGMLGKQLLACSFAQLNSHYTTYNPIFYYTDRYATR